jgi:1-acyl-sn-glycerol-3-phosphate acyltransferase
MLYAIVQIMVGLWARFFFRLQVFGHDLIPKQGGVLVASNHVSYLDIPLLGCAMKRRANFIGKSELIRNPIMAFLFRHLNGIPIKRGGVNRKTLQDIADRLKKGEVVVIYPEGGINRSGALKTLKPGIGMLVAMAGVPVVPALIKGTDKALPIGARWIRRYPVKIFFGQPMDFQPRLDRDKGKLLYQEISHEVMLGLKQLESEWEHSRGNQEAQDAMASSREGVGRRL